MSAPAVPAGGASVLDRLQVLRFAPTPLRGAPAATWTQSPRTGVGQLPVPGTGLQPWLHDTTTTSTDPAGSTLATPDFGPKNGVHLTHPERVRSVAADVLFRVYPGFPIRLGALPGFVVGDLMWKALWKFVENEQRFPRRGGRVLCVHGAVSFHRARPCARPVCRPGRHEGSLEAYRQNCDESGLQMSPPGPLRRHDLPDRGQPRYPCADSEPFAYPVR